MALTTYTELKASIADWLNRTDLTTTIPDFISLAEAQIERTLRTRQMIVRANASFDSEYGAVPADFLETPLQRSKTFQGFCQGHTPLLRASMNFSVIISLTFIA